MSTARQRYFDRFSSSLDLETIDTPATYIRLEDDRAGSNLIVGYNIGAVTVVRGGPEHAALVEPLASPDRSHDHDALRVWATQNAWIDFDGGRSHVLEPGDVVDAPVPDGLRIVTLQSNGADNERVRQWLGAADPDDVDAGDFDVDELDDRMVALVDDADQIMAIASSYPWELAEEFEDIGVIVAPDARGRGAGRAVVRALLDRIHDDGQLGLYRCNWSNPISRQLALGLGFEEVTNLIALCPKGDPKATG